MKKPRAPKPRNPVARDMLTSGAFKRRMVESKKRKPEKHPKRSTEESKNE